MITYRRKVRSARVRALSVLLTVLATALVLTRAWANPIVSEERASTDVDVRILSIREGVVSALITNHSRRPLRDVRVLVRHQWIWRDERTHSGDDPGRVAYRTVHEQIPPEVSVAFTYEPTPPLPSRSDGHFETSVEVVGYSEVGE